MDPINLHLITRKFVQEQNHVGDKSAVRQSCKEAKKNRSTSRAAPNSTASCAFSRACCCLAASAFA